jgi:cyclophilin family peptidyl-prolyl cis-trans isomerase
MYRRTCNAGANIPKGLPVLLLVFGLFVVAACAAPVKSASDAQAAGPLGHGSFRVQVSTERGDLTLVLDEAAAPQAVAAVRHAFTGDAYAGVAIGWVRPHTEIRTQVPKGAIPMESELDARALGLHEVRIQDVGAAMNAIQFELEPAFVRAGAKASPQLREWIGIWREHFDAAFLVGVSRQQINEALGYRYREGYATRPARRGSVALVPDQPGSTTLALSILLRDQPKRDGAWVVIGQVESGLELAQSLSIAPRVHPKFFEPENPVRITRTEVTESHPD